MEPITLAQLLEAVHGRLLGSFDRLDTPISKVETDSRSIHPGTLFLPLVGERPGGGHRRLHHRPGAGQLPAGKVLCEGGGHPAGPPGPGRLA